MIDANAEGEVVTQAYDTTLLPLPFFDVSDTSSSDAMPRHTETTETTETTEATEATELIKREPTPAQVGYFRRGLERGHVKLGLIRALAKGEESLMEIARRHNTSHGAIQAFAARHADEIAALKADIASLFGALWIADKAARLAEYQQDAEDIDATLAVDGVDTNLMRAKHRVLRSAAEELGQLPTRTQINVGTENIVYEVVGVNIEDLK